MIKLTEAEIIDGQNEAYLKAGHNAYFGDGFNAGVEFALKQINKLPTPITLGINSCASLIKSMPTDQAIQIMKSDITGQSQAALIEGELVVAYVRNIK